MFRSIPRLNSLDVGSTCFPVVATEMSPGISKCPRVREWKQGGFELLMVEKDSCQGSLIEIRLKRKKGGSQVPATRVWVTCGELALHVTIDREPLRGLNEGVVSQMCVTWECAMALSPGTGRWARMLIQ